VLLLNRPPSFGSGGAGKKGALSVSRSRELELPYCQVVHADLAGLIHKLLLEGDLSTGRLRIPSPVWFRTVDPGHAGELEGKNDEGHHQGDALS
jgi:hypothetical protein